jgi:hypothetical protein
MRDDEGHGDEPGQDLDGVAVRNVSEFFYAGRPAVIVRTTRLEGSEEERQASGDEGLLVREMRTAELRP